MQSAQALGIATDGWGSPKRSSLFDVITTSTPNSTSTANYQAVVRSACTLGVNEITADAPLFLFRSLPLGFSGQARTPLWPPGCSRRSRARTAEGGNPVGPLLHTPLKAAPGGDIPLSGCPLRSGLTGASVCPGKGVTPRAPLSPSRVAAISLRHQGGYPSLWNGFIRSSSSSHPPIARLKGRTI